MTLRDEVYYKEQDSFVRQKEKWFGDIPKHIAAFLKKGGTIYYAEPGESVYKKRYEDGTAAQHFVIKRGRE